MRVRIDISVNLSDETIGAFRALEGEPTEKALQEYILKFGVTGLEYLVIRHDEHELLPRVMF